MSIEDTIRDTIRDELAKARFQRPADDLLLTAEQAAELLQVSASFLYMHAKTLPYAVVLTNGGKKATVRFSYVGIQKFISKRLRVQEAKNGQ